MIGQLTRLLPFRRKKGADGIIVNDDGEIVVNLTGGRARICTRDGGIMIVLRKEDKRDGRVHIANLTRQTAKQFAKAILQAAS
jgi:hypothetical protein